MQKNMMRYLWYNNLIWRFKLANSFLAYTLLFTQITVTGLLGSPMLVDSQSKLHQISTTHSLSTVQEATRANAKLALLRKSELNGGSNLVPSW